MGDPETQPIMMRLRSDFFDVMMAATAGTLDQVDLQWDRRVALGVVMAAAGYPLQPRKGDPITGLPKPADDAMVFHAGTVQQDGAILTAGGRVLCVTALADSVKAAQQRAYEVVQRHPVRRRAVPARHRPSGRAAGARARQPMTQQTAQVRAYLQDLQQRITSAFAQVDGNSFVADAWRKGRDEPLQGEGVSMILEGGGVFERAGCGFSHVTGPRLPPSATQHRPDLAGASFEAMGVSLVFHPRNPYAPTVHMNVRMLAAMPSDGEPVYWFGGGMDLTPYYGFEEDAVHFHTVCTRRAGALRRRQVPALQDLVRRVFLHQAPRRAARHRRHLLRRLRRGRPGRQLRAGTRSWATPSCRPTCRSCSGAATCRTASASASSSCTGAAATSSSTSSGTAAPTSACSRAGAPSRS